MLVYMSYTIPGVEAAAISGQITNLKTWADGLTVCTGEADKAGWERSSGAGDGDLEARWVDLGTRVRVSGVQSDDLASRSASRPFDRHCDAPHVGQCNCQP